MQKKVTRKELRDMHVGQTRIIVLEDRKKMVSARVTATQMKNVEGLEFIVKSDWQASSVCITRTK